MAWRLRNIFRPEGDANQGKIKQEKESTHEGTRRLSDGSPVTLLHEILLWKKRWRNQPHKMVDLESFLAQFANLFPDQEKNLRSLFMRAWNEVDFNFWHHAKHEDKQPDITTVVTVYNVSENIRECIKSIQYQTLRSIEIVIVDDCSPDNSIKLIGDIILKDNRFVYVRALKNRGLLQARHIGGRFARGEYLTFVDGDDFLIPNIYEKSLSKANETKADITQFGMYRLQNDRLFPHDYAIPKHELLVSRDILHKHLTFEINYSMCNKLFRVSMWNDLLEKFPKGRYDVEDLSRIGIICLNSYVYTGVNDMGYVYRFREESDSQEVTLDQTATRMFSTARHLAKLKMELREKKLISLYASELGDYEALLYRIKPKKFLSNSPEKIRTHIQWLKKTYRVNGFMPLNSHISAFSQLVHLIDYNYSRLINIKDKSYITVILLVHRHCQKELALRTIHNLNRQIVGDITKFEILLVYDEETQGVISEIIRENEFEISVKPILVREANLKAALEYALPRATSQFLILLRSGMELNPRHLSTMLRQRQKHKVNIIFADSPLPEDKNTVPYTDFPDILNRSEKVSLFGTLFRTEPMILLRSMFREIDLPDYLLEDPLMLSMIILTRGNLAQAGKEFSVRGEEEYEKKPTSLKYEIKKLPSDIIEYSNYIQLMRYLSNFYTATRGKNKVLLSTIEKYLLKRLLNNKSMELLRTLKISQTMTYYQIMSQISDNIRMDFLEESLGAPAKSNKIVASLPQSITVKTELEMKDVKNSKTSMNTTNNKKEHKVPIIIKNGINTLGRSIEGAGRGVEKMVVRVSSSQKKYIKYKDDPERFFRDSKWEILRKYGKAFHSKPRG